MFKVYVTDHVFENLESEQAILAEADARVISLECKDISELKTKAHDADALMNTYLSPINGDVMDSMKNLKVIVRYGIGFNTIDIEAATQRGIQVANVPDYCLHEVSDHAVALVLDLVRKVTLSCGRVKQALDYSLGYLKPVRSLQTSDVTIFGFGRIGRLIAGKLAGFGCKLHFYDPYVKDDQYTNDICVQKSEFDEAMEMSDIIILQAPSTKENYHMLDARAFGLMKRKPFVVNTARGELIDKHALIVALKNGAVSGAGLDVVEGMPPVDKNEELLKFDSVILTPHSAWFSDDALVQLQRLAATEVLRVLKGGWVKSLVNPEVKNTVK